jgi:hypothetical protein
MATPLSWKRRMLHDTGKQAFLLDRVEVVSLQ